MPMTRRAYERDLEERIAQVNDAPLQLRSNYDAQKSENTKKVDTVYWRSINRFHDFCKNAGIKAEIRAIVTKYPDAESIFEMC